VKNELIANELRRIADEHDGIVKPEIVVEEARSEDSPMHSHFEWDDSEAAHRYRIWQARVLISSVEVITPQREREPVFVSVTIDRAAGGGYRLLRDVMSSEDLRTQLLIDAKKEMIHFKLKYQQIHELSKVFAAMDEAVPTVEHALSAAV
jgi:hypothetical protein